jgi:hypothetical protein
MMNAPEFFGVMVRTIGFGFALYGVYTLMWGCLLMLWPHYERSKESPDEWERQESGPFFFSGGILLLLGICAIAEAETIVKMTY